jgi:hypothetical protein
MGDKKPYQYSGYLKDPTTGDLKAVYLFVAAMSYS